MGLFRRKAQTSSVTYDPGTQKPVIKCSICNGIHKGDYKRGINTNEIVKTKDFRKPTEKLKNGSYKMKAGIAVSIYKCNGNEIILKKESAVCATAHTFLCLRFVD